MLYLEVDGILRHVLEMVAAETGSKKKIFFSPTTYYEPAGK